jgi:hypothetical protein
LLADKGYDSDEILLQAGKQGMVGYNGEEK